jgi:hypothetical protein
MKKSQKILLKNVFKVISVNNHRNTETTDPSSVFSQVEFQYNNIKDEFIAQ